MQLKDKKSERISYAELSKKLGGVVLCNNVTQVDEDNWPYSFIVGPLLEQRIEELNSDPDYNFTEDEPASVHDLAEGCIYQSYIIDDMAARDLVNHTTELVTYSEKLEVFVWHVTHYGTSWSGVHLDWYERSDDIEDDHTQYAGSTEELLKWQNG
jgi:hypothetical protein